MKFNTNKILTKLCVSMTYLPHNTLVQAGTRLIKIEICKISFIQYNFLQFFQKLNYRDPFFYLCFPLKLLSCEKIIDVRKMSQFVEKNKVSNKIFATFDVMLMKVFLTNSQLNIVRPSRKYPLCIVLQYLFTHERSMQIFDKKRCPRTNLHVCDPPTKELRSFKMVPSLYADAQ